MKSAKGMIHSLFVPHWRHVWKLKEITKLEKISLSDFTLCGAKLLHKLPKQLEEHKNSVPPDLQQFIDCLCRLFRYDGKCERKSSVLPVLHQFMYCLYRLRRHNGKCGAEVKKECYVR